jgi:hypothetical protein
MKKVKKAWISWKQDSTLGQPQLPQKLHLIYLEDLWINYLNDPVEIYLLEKGEEPQPKLGWFYGKGIVLE